MAESTNPNVEHEPGDVTGEETEPEAMRSTTMGVDAGIPGQIEYPEVNVDAERAAAFAGGKVDSLDPDDEEGERDGWQNPADRSGEVQHEDDEDDAEARRHEDHE